MADGIEVKPTGSPPERATERRRPRRPPRARRPAPPDRDHFPEVEPDPADSAQETGRIDIRV
jgi:hypothetical protein